MKSNSEKDQTIFNERNEKLLTVVYIDKSEIREGKFEDTRKSIKNLVKFVEKNVPQMIYYGFFFNDKHTQMTVISVHPDAESLEYLMTVGKEEFRKFSDLLDLYKMEVYGNITDSVHALLQQKVKMLGKGTVEVNDFYDGFFRS